MTESNVGSQAGGGGQGLALRLAAAMGAMAVLMGAFAAHGLKAKLLPDHPEWLDAFKTGAQYQMYHSLAMLAVAMGAGFGRWMSRACWCWLAGMVLFSGSLYALALTGQTWLGAVTPFGGLSFVAGWVCLFLAAKP